MPVKTNNMETFINGYLDQLGKLLNNLDRQAISVFINEIEAARESQNTIFIVGNGGSAATASHMANDFGVNIFLKHEKEKPLRAVSLTDNTATMLAIGNDSGFENLFVNQLRALYHPGDKLVAISASGNSPNILAAARWVKQRKGTVIGLVGFDGGELKKIADTLIHVKTPKGEYGPVEDIHLVINHLIVTWLQNKYSQHSS